MPIRPLSLPDDFNPETDMLARSVDDQTYHAPIPAIRLAYDLVQNGTREDLDQAERDLERVLLSPQGLAPEEIAEIAGGLIFYCMVY